MTSDDSLAKFFFLRSGELSHPFYLSLAVLDLILSLRSKAWGLEVRSMCSL